MVLKFELVIDPSRRHCWAVEMPPDWRFQPVIVWTRCRRIVLVVPGEHLSQAHVACMKLSHCW